MTERVLCPPDHKHGETPTCYRTHKCGCDECRNANAARCYEYKKLIAYGRPTSNLVNAAPARAHLLELTREGWGPKAIAAAAKVDRTTIMDLINDRRPNRMMRREISERILRLTSEEMQPTPGMLVSNRGTIRRVQALGTLGWSEVEIAKRTGIHSVTLNMMQHRKGILQQYARRIAALYELLWDVPAETDPRVAAQAAWITRGHARRAGYLPPMAWDDIDTDPWPPATHRSVYLVDDVAVELALQGQKVRLHPQEIAEVVKRGSERQLSAATIAERVDRTPRTITRKRTTAVRRAVSA